MSSDFTLYDHVLDFSTTFNVIPAKYAAADVSELDRYFAMGRGRQVGGVDLPAQEMQKWFGKLIVLLYRRSSMLTSCSQTPTTTVGALLEFSKITKLFLTLLYRLEGRGLL